MRRRSQSATLTNFSLVSELGESWQEDAWSVSVSCPEVQNSQCGCYYSKNTGSYGCYKMLQNPHNIWVCAHIKTNDSVIVLDKQSLRTINKCSSSRYSSLPLRQTTCSFLLYLDFYFSALCQVNPSIFRFLCLSPCLSPFHPPPTCLLYCSALWLDESLSRTILTLSELVIPLAISNRPGWEKEGGRGTFPSVPFPLQGGRSGHDFESEAQADWRPAWIGLDGAGPACLAWRPLEIKVYLIGHIHGQLSHNKDGL